MEQKSAKNILCFTIIIVADSTIAKQESFYKSSTAETNKKAAQLGKYFLKGYNKQDFRFCHSRENTDDISKIEQLKQWCDDVNKRQSKIHYSMLYIKQEDFKKYKSQTFSDLVQACKTME